METCADERLCSSVLDRWRSVGRVEPKAESLLAPQITVLYQRGTIETHRNKHWSVKQRKRKRKKRGKQKNWKDFRRKAGAHYCASPGGSQLHSEANRRRRQTAREQCLLSCQRQAGRAQTCGNTCRAAYEALTEGEARANAGFLLQQLREVNGGK